jgi:hypothetical protein
MRINMDMDNAATWLAGSILLMLGFVVFVIGIVIINNILHKFWKPIKLFTPDSWTGFNPPDHMGIRINSKMEITPQPEIGKDPKK